MVNWETKILEDRKRKQQEKEERNLPYATL